MEDEAADGIPDGGQIHLAAMRDEHPTVTAEGNLSVNT